MPLTRADHRTVRKLDARAKVLLDRGGEGPCSAACTP